MIVVGHLDRRVNGQVALDILSACDDEENRTVSSTTVPSKSKGGALGKKLSNLTSNLPTGAATAAVKKLKTRAGMSSSSPTTTAKTQEEDAMVDSSFVPLKVLSTKAAVSDAEIHVMLFDTEAVICHLMKEENLYLSSKLVVKIT
jgi:hypothetical protein